MPLKTMKPNQTNPVANSIFQFPMAFVMKFMTFLEF